MQNTRVTLDQITSFKDFLKHIDKLQFPNQMGCILESRYLQHLLVVTQNEAAVIRLNFWLQQALYEELVCAPSGVTRERVTKFLEALLNFVSFYQKPLASLESCLAQYLLTWNGVDYQTLIFLLVSQLQIKPFQKLNDLVLEPIRKLFFCSSVEFKCQVLSCLTEMLLTLARSTLVTAMEEDKPSQSTSATPLSVNDLPMSNNETRETCLVIKGLIGFVNRICTVASQMESDHILLQHCILCFFEQVSILHKNYPSVWLFYIPSSAIIYRLLFASNPMAVSRLCNLIVNYKETFESLKRAQLSSAEGDVFDGLENTQEEGIKFNPSLIRGKTRTVYLEFLRRQNLHGVIRFLNTFIKQK
ncbi:centromere I-like [Paramuricea clavata]|uniref:Centromere I-like n=1 Tax=Paramuricea clavata TaxID=317549 RepID=A0A6S7I512_PARCT|nr:centromere I-like [Paramuricea clavata]